MAWGPSPTYGELCYGESSSKSSTTPKESKPLEGCYVHAVMCGMGHTLLIARDDTDEERKRINSFPAFGPLREIPEEEKLAREQKKEAEKKADEVEEEEEEEEEDKEEEAVEDVTPESAAAAAAASAAERAANAVSTPSEEDEEDESPTRVPFTVKEGESEKVEEPSKTSSADVTPVNGSGKVEETTDEEAKQEETKPSEDAAATDKEETTS